MDYMWSNAKSKKHEKTENLKTNLFSKLITTTTQTLLSLKTKESKVEGLTDFVSDPEDSTGAPRRNISRWVPSTVTSDHMVHLGSNPVHFKAHWDDNQSNNHNILQSSHYDKHKPNTQFFFLIIFYHSL